MASTSASGSGSAPSSTSASTPTDALKSKATSILVIGMAGSGKSTFAGALSKFAAEAEEEKSKSNSNEAEKKETSYLVNLDPAVGGLNYEPNVDIRDTIDYKRVMEEYNLGPNGGILTSLNLFTTKFDQVLSILERRSSEVDQIILDTPGQIEIFTWSASGTIITDSLASSIPTCIAYVIDTPRTTAPATFMSNMLYACSIMYKTKLPFIIVFNKIDLQPHDFALDWMSDFEAFQEALSKGNATDSLSANQLHGSISNNSRLGGGGEDGGSYMNSLMNSMALVLDEFYNNIRTVGFSSITGQGYNDLQEAIQDARREYMDEYVPELNRVKEMKKKKEEERKKEQVRKLMKDMRVGKRAGQNDAKDPEEEEEKIASNIVPSYDGDGQILDPDDQEYVQQSASQGQAGQQQQRGGEHLDRSSSATQRKWDKADWPQPE
ncbi:unnamed protein product [Sympodiomycopsis kandeliae]